MKGTDMKKASSSPLQMTSLQNNCCPRAVAECLCPPRFTR